MLPVRLLQHLRYQGIAYLPGIGSVKVVRVPAAYSEDGVLSPPSIALERISLGAKQSEEDLNFYRENPEVLKWIQQHEEELNSKFEFDNSWNFQKTDLSIGTLPTIRSVLPSKNYAVGKKEPFNWRKIAVVALLLAIFAVFYQQSSFEKASAFLGNGAIEIADFQEELALINGTKASQSIKENPYFKEAKISSESYVLVSGVFSKEENARKWMDFLSTKGIESAIIPGPSGLLRVCSLPVDTDFEAVHLMDEWRKNHGLHTWVLPI